MIFHDLATRAVGWAKEGRTLIYSSLLDGSSAELSILLSALAWSPMGYLPGAPPLHRWYPRTSLWSVCWAVYLMHDRFTLVGLSCSQMCLERSLTRETVTKASLNKAY